MAEFRLESDSMGLIRVPADRYRTITGFEVTPVVGGNQEHLVNTHGTAFLVVTRDGATGEIGHQLLVARPEAMPSL